MDCPTNTSDTLISGGTNAIAGAGSNTYTAELLTHGATEPVLHHQPAVRPSSSQPITDLPFETIDSLIWKACSRLKIDEDRALGRQPKPGGRDRPAQRSAKAPRRGPGSSAHGVRYRM